MSRFATLALTVVLLAACDSSAPRDNPRDPLSPGYDGTGTLTGTVTGTVSPFPVRADVLVRITPSDASGTPTPGADSRLAISGPDGRFEVMRLPAGIYAVQVEGSDVRSDVVVAQVGAQDTSLVTLRANSLPVVQSQEARTVYVESRFGADPYRVEIGTRISDADDIDDVDAVVFVVEELGIRDTMMQVVPSASQTTADFRITLPQDGLPGGSAQPLLGQALRIEVTDDAGNVIVGDPFGLVRIIGTVPTPVSPVNFPGGLDPADLELLWDSEPLPYPYAFLVEVTADRPGLEQVVVSATVPADSTSYRVPTQLPSGTYFWTVSYVDQVGNRGRSTEARFEFQ
ncbi:MAG: hypothetical protein AAGK21_09360 [Bacteroidota bacterium]